MKITARIICPSCKHVYDDQLPEGKCEICAFPFHGSQKKRSKHIAAGILKKRLLNDSQKSIINAQRILVVVGFLFLINLGLTGFQTEVDWLTMTILIILSLTFFASAILIRKAPLLFTIFPMALLLLLYILNFVQDPASLYRGILLKIAIMGGLIYCVNLIVKGSKVEKENSYLED